MRVALIVAASVLAAAPALAQGTPPPDAIAVEADADGCPTRAELVAALEARLPRATLDEDDHHEGARRLLVDRAGEDGAVRLRLLDGAGTPELERRLEAGQGAPATARGGGRCAALAEAAAQVVARYLKEIGYRAPASETAPAPPPPAAPPARVPTVVASPAPPGPGAPGDWLGLIGLTGGGRRGIGGGSSWSRSELLLALEVRRRWLTVSVAGGITSRTDVAIPGTEPDSLLLLRSYPLRVAVGAALPGPLGGMLLPTVGANLDWLSFKGQGVALDDAGSGTRFDPALEAGAGWGRRWGHLMLVVRLAGGWSLQPRDFDAHRADPIFRSPAGYLRAAVETAFVLGR